MKLYYSPGACPLTIHVLLNDLGIDYQLVRVDLKSHKTEDGRDYYEINPKGYVPTLELESGERITELPAVAQYLSESQQNYHLFPQQGLPKIRVIEWLAFIGSEVHKSFAPLFNPASSEEAKKAAQDKINNRFGYIDQVLQQQAYVTGDILSIADIYLFVILTWANNMKLDLSQFPNLQIHQQKVGEYPAVQKSLKEEGLM